MRRPSTSHTRAISSPTPSRGDRLRWGRRDVGGGAGAEGVCSGVCEVAGEWGSAGGHGEERVTADCFSFWQRRNCGVLSEGLRGVMEKVLILDANQRSALAATRSLGRRGVQVVVADEFEKTLSGASRHCSENFVYPSPFRNPEGFIQAMQKEALQREIGVIFPMTEVTTHLILKCRDAFPGIQIPFVSLEAFEALSDKGRLDRMARQLKIPVPQTYPVSGTEGLNAAMDALTFPVVLKPCRSRIFSNGRWIGASVRYAVSEEALRKVIAEEACFRDHPFLVQEYIRGTGQGIFALYDQGRPLVFFAHRRLREKPPSGGVSVLSESVAVDPRMREMAEKVLNEARWHGVAMVEFKVTSEGTPYLMEVNARFWGSLQLAVDAGVDFPWLLYQLAIGKPVSPVEAYQVGIQSRWLLGDLDHLYLKLKERKNPLPFSEKCRSIAAFLKFFGREMRYEINRWDDFKPFLHELKTYFKGGQ